MIGLYILIHSILTDVLRAFKFGMSMRLHERWYDYWDTWKGATYKYIIIIKNLEEAGEIKFLEQEILTQTTQYYKQKLGNEYRDINLISINEFIIIIKKVLNSYGINYKILKEPLFDKPKQKINESNNHEIIKKK